jgi:hypothetical protein
MSQKIGFGKYAQLSYEAVLADTSYCNWVLKAGASTQDNPSLRALYEWLLQFAVDVGKGPQMPIGPAKATTQGSLDAPPAYHGAGLKPLAIIEQPRLMLIYNGFTIGPKNTQFGQELADGDLIVCRMTPGQPGKTTFILSVAQGLWAKQMKVVGAGSYIYDLTSDRAPSATLDSAALGAAQGARGVPLW